MAPSTLSDIGSERDSILRSESTANPKTAMASLIFRETRPQDYERIPFAHWTRRPFDRPARFGATGWGITVTWQHCLPCITLIGWAGLYDAGFSVITNNASTGQQTYRGTMAGTVPPGHHAGHRPPELFPDRPQGMQAVQAGTPVVTASGPEA